MGFLFATRRVEMPDWTAPFHRPHMTTEAFKKMKAEYVAEHGYTITVPGLSDIIKLKFDQPLSEGEVKAWKRKDKAYFTPKRYEDIRLMKQRRKEKFLAMLASPTPHIVNNAGSLMTSIDDAQDALATLAFIGLLAIKAAPRILGQTISGPVGWTMTAAETLNQLQHLGMNKLARLPSQNAMYKAQHASPYSRKVKVKKMARAMKWMPHKGFLIEAAQVSNNVFGVGLCLGPLVGFGIDSVTGPYRIATGEPVYLKLPWPIHPGWTRLAKTAVRGMLPYMSSGLQTEPEEVMMMTMANYLVRQELLTGAKDWNAMENVVNMDKVELLAPYPTNALTLEVIEEEKIKVQDVIGWPHSSRPWALTTDIVKELDQPSQDFQRDFFELHKRDWWAYAFGALNNDATCSTLATAEGEDQIEYSFTAVATTTQVLTQMNRYPHPATPPQRMQLFADQMDIWEAMDIQPTYRDITEFCDSKGIYLKPFTTTQAERLEGLARSEIDYR